MTRSIPTEALWLWVTPWGATGAFLTCKVLDYLQDPETAGTYGMVTMCIGGGMGACGIYELCK